MVVLLGVVEQPKDRRRDHVSCVHIRAEQEAVAVRDDVTLAEPRIINLEGKEPSDEIAKADVGLVATPSTHMSPEIGKQVAVRLVQRLVRIVVDLELLVVRSYRHHPPTHQVAIVLLWETHERAGHDHGQRGHRRAEVPPPCVQHRLEQPPCGLAEPWDVWQKSGARHDLL